MEKINKQYVQRSGNDAIYGTGFDGDATISSEITLTSDAYYNNLTITSTGFLRTNGFRVFVKNNLTIDAGGKIGVGPNNAGTDPSDVSNGTVAGHTTASISYRLGGQGGGATNPNIPTLPSFLLKDINVLSSGLIFDPTSGVIALQGGSRGTTGSKGADTPALTDSDIWPGKAGAEGSAGSYGPSANTVGVPGGKGNPASPGTATGATPGIGGAGGAGGSGGPIVCIVAKNILGSGSIVSVGKRGAAGIAGTAGNPGTQGANGTAAPNLTHTNPALPNPHHYATPTHHTNPHHYALPTVTYPYAWIRAGNDYAHASPSGEAPHFDHVTNNRYSDLHAHASKGANHHAPARHTAASGKTPAHHTAAAHHENPHYHHNGGGHHPHRDAPHGGMHHWYNASWHRRYQVSHSNAIAHNHVKPNGHTSHGVTGNGHHHTDFYHQHAGGTNNNASVGSNFVPHSHSNHHHVPAPFNVSNHHSHTPHAQGHTQEHLQGSPVAQADTIYPGGAGGVNNGTTTGRGAPAAIGQTGKSGGSGGGGAILVITDSVSGTITYDTSARSATDSDNFSATSGSVYVLINQ